MLKFILYPMLLLAAMPGHSNSAFLNSTTSLAKHTNNTIPDKISGNKIVAAGEAKASLYNLWQLDNHGISRKAFACAMKGLDYLSRTGMVAKRNIISIVDFSRPSTQKRLFVIDMASGKVLFKTWVAHGQNSGDEYARNFSNSMDSHQSSLGFYITMGTYIGGNGYSLRLKGCEKGINDNAYERAIVLHGADYVSTRFINSRGELGRSYGCPAVPMELSQQIIDKIKNGSCLFLYHPTKKYCGRSKILNSRV